MKEWLEVIRDERFFNLLVMNVNVMSCENEFVIDTTFGECTVQHDELYPITRTDIPNAPNFIAVSDVQSRVTSASTSSNVIPHAAEPKPAQRAGNITFIWGETVDGLIQPHRDDGFPAVIIAVGLCKYYQYGELSRTPQHPAIKAQHLAALWYEKGSKLFRANGPSSISFDDYKEFWVDGEYRGQKWSEFHEKFNATSNVGTLPKFLNNLSGNTDMFSDKYFLDLEDEVCYIASYA